MPDDDKQPESTPAPEPTPKGGIDEEKLASAIAKGLSTQLAELREQPSPSPISAAPALPAIEEVNEEDIARAIREGDDAKASQLLRKARAADRLRAERNLQPALAQGAAAISSMAQSMAARDLPHYAEFRKEIDSEIDKFKANNPGVMITTDHYRIAHNMVVGANADKIAQRAREEAIRQRDNPPTLEPSGNSRDISPKEPLTLQDALVGDWKKDFREKQRSKDIGRRTDDEEMRRAQFRDVAGFLQTRRELAAFEDEHPGLGLDEDWDPVKQEWRQ